MINVIHISDTHFGATEDFAFGEAVVLPQVRAIVDRINDLEFEPDVIIHSGDVVDDPGEVAYRIASAELSRLRAPVYYACGNHDDGRMLLNHLEMRERAFLGEDVSKLAYSLRLGGTRIFVLDGCDTGPSGGRGEISDSQFEVFASAVRNDVDPFLVVVHFPPVAVGYPWVDREMVLKGGERLHSFLREEARDRLGGVFFGHAHCGIEVRREGILYRGVGSACCRIRSGPVDERAVFEPRAPVFFNHISVSGEGIVVRELGLGVGDEAR